MSELLDLSELLDFFFPSPGMAEAVTVVWLLI